MSPRFFGLTTLLRWLPWTKKIVFKNGDTEDYRKENVELVPRKTSW